MRLPACGPVRITQDEYDKKARELKGRQTELALRIEQHQEGEGSPQRAEAPRGDIAVALPTFE